MVPGFAGARSAKWLTAITVQDAPSDNHMRSVEPNGRFLAERMDGVVGREMPNPHAQSDASIVRKELALFKHVTRTWFEIEFAPHNLNGERILVVEVDIDTDPSAHHPAGNEIERIKEAACLVLGETTMVVHRIRIVPAAPPQFTPPRPVGSE